jgi:hypothetical protein
MVINTLVDQMLMLGIFNILGQYPYLMTGTFMHIWIFVGMI